jgi:hypothetical protein
MRIRYLFFFIVSIPFLSSCDVRGFAERFIPEAESEFAKEHFDLYRTGDVDQIISQLNPAPVDDQIKGQIEAIVEYVPSIEPVGLEVVGASTHTSGDSRIVSLSIEYEYPDEWLLFSVTVDASSTPFKVNAVNALRMEQSLAETNAFRLAQNGLPGLLIVIFGVAVPLFCIAVFVMCLRTPIPKGKWRWAIFTLLGAMTYQMNWTTGEAAFIPMHVQLLGAGFGRAGFYGPWIISVSIPFGALVFLSKRKKWLINAQPPENQGSHPAD